MTTEREVIEAHGFDPARTSVDRLMAGPITMHLEVAEAMTNGGDEPTEDEPYYNLETEEYEL